MIIISEGAWSNGEVFIQSLFTGANNGVWIIGVFGLAIAISFVLMWFKLGINRIKG